jgi:hypothetical protein
MKDMVCLGLDSSSINITNAANGSILNFLCRILPRETVEFWVSYIWGWLDWFNIAGSFGIFWPILLNFEDTTKNNCEQEKSCKNACNKYSNSEYTWSIISTGFIESSACDASTIFALIAMSETACVSS